MIMIHTLLYVELGGKYVHEFVLEYVCFAEEV